MIDVYTAAGTFADTPTPTWCSTSSARPRRQPKAPRPPRRC